MHELLTANDIHGGSGKSAEREYGLISGKRKMAQLTTDKSVEPFTQLWDLDDS